MLKKRIIFGKPYLSDAEKNEILDTLDSGWLGKGPKVAKFEKDFKNYIGCKYVVALNSCTAGLFIALKYFGIKEGDEVITTPLTFAATANAIENCGATPIFVDVYKDNGTINADLIEEKITKKTKAILPVHYCGYPCEMDKILQIAKKYKLKLIEDAAHCIEGKYKGRKIGAIGDATSFSFYATKNITTGEGGALTTNDKKLYEFARLYSTQGLSADAWNRQTNSKQKYYEVVLPGFKFNMFDLQAALGIHQLKKINEFYKIRLVQWKKYTTELADTGLIMPKLSAVPGSVHALHLFTILVDKKLCGKNRDELQIELQKKGIGTGIHFISLHNHKFYMDKYKLKKSDFPNANYISERTLSLPIGPTLQDFEQEYIIKMIKIIL